MKRFHSLLSVTNSQVGGSIHLSLITHLVISRESVTREVGTRRERTKLELMIKVHRSLRHTPLRKDFSCDSSLQLSHFLAKLFFFCSKVYSGPEELPFVGLMDSAVPTGTVTNVDGKRKQRSDSSAINSCVSGTQLQHLF